MTKKDYQLFANALAQIKSKATRVKVVKYLIPCFLEDNYQFDPDKFMEWVERVAKGESTKGLG